MASKEELFRSKTSSLLGNGATPKAVARSQVSGGNTMFRNQSEQICMIDPNMIGPFSVPSAKPDGGQAFEVVRDQEFESLKEKILSDGIQQPAVIRPWPYQENPCDYRYEMIVGHRRQLICKDTGMLLPCVIRRMDDNEAIIVMTTTNTEGRHKPKPSELAWAYRMEFDARKHQGKPLNSLTEVTEEPVCVQEDAESAHSADTTADLIGKSRGISGRTVSRYIRLSYLIPEILNDYVNSEQVKIVTGVHLSYLPDSIQRDVMECLRKGIRVDETAAKTLRELHDHGKLKTTDVEAVLTGKKKAPAVPSYKIPSARLKRFFPKKAKPDQVEQDIFDALTVQSIVKEHFPNATTEEICAELRLILSRTDEED